MLAVAALYVIGFVIKNSKNVDVDFVLFSTGLPLITLMVVMLLFGRIGNFHVVFADYGITAPTSPVVASIRDEGEMEFQIFFRKA